MSARTKARKRALDILYAADVRQISINESLAAEAARALTEPAREASWEYAREIVDGFVSHGYEIDELIETYAVGWTLGRMPHIDRALLRIGIWEILYNDGVPDAVAIAEAVEAAQSMSTDDSAGFINGILAKIAQTKGVAH
ncbi:transcription antitermination factor NusB [Subtercola boreus]|uniref:Transcription antitermination protein NusB n=1 Tax=Subtercola boreus TaxID=120213 RepID=A0A3E0VXY8_9MICO|nr:transcription antitermination factor NusB [Subtercola boreus]MDF2442975.1 transcription antitermination protein NusB [Subtercola sp.]RFA12705.1 transcription antitermination factor NusB [Subtercola boreus]RFA14756.1 transcription antitermination factor NusB [Subtercola boreus]